MNLINDMNVRNIEVILDDLENNPYCFHGPTLRFKKHKGKTKEYYACSACRDHKDCNFYLPVSEKNSKLLSDEYWKTHQKEAIKVIKKSKPYMKLQKILNSFKNNKREKETTANYCHSCNCLFEKTEINSHKNCSLVLNLTFQQLTHPSEILIPKTDTKIHAQYFFSKSSVNDMVLLLERLKANKILCIGVPRIHECILSNPNCKMKSMLLDIDKSYYNFYNKNNFIWFNMFNNYIFDEAQHKILNNFLNSGKIVILIDPPFGGRVEPLARTLSILKETFNQVRDQKSDSSLYTFWFFPYFMEQHIIDSLPNFKMFDYKVNYDNHSSFTNSGNRKRKFGSPVRIFTDVPLFLLNLSGINGYKFCKLCGFWVSNENKHCKECKSCTSKNGRTYVHCFKCSKCVKPSYEHCDSCSRCCLVTHVCGEFQPDPNCYHCHRPGHKKTECPDLNKRKRRNLEKDKTKGKRLKFRIE